MELAIPSHKFMCVDYPAIVNNVDNMVKTLGGIGTLSKTYNDATKRMELWFRARNIDCKPAYGDRKPCNSLLLKVRRRRKDAKTDAETSSESSQLEVEYDVKILGVVDVMYKFQSMSDFQYLPMVSQSNATYKSIRREVFITQLSNSSWLNEPAPLYLPPPSFSRFDRSVAYCYREPPQPRPGNEDLVPKFAPNVIGVSRKRRPHYTIFAHFSDKAIPSVSHSSAGTLIREVYKRNGVVTTIQQHYDSFIVGSKRGSTVSAAALMLHKMFERQPIWSRSALLGQLDYSLSLKDLFTILPTMAYYCINGPWRSMWVRFGYDPRAHPEAKIYQTLDVRLRRTVAFVFGVEPGLVNDFSVERNVERFETEAVRDDVLVKAKRSTYDFSLPNATSKNVSQPALINESTFSALADAKPSSDKCVEDVSFRFRPGIIPPYRQMFYHLCHVDEPQVQKLVHHNDGKETECLEKDGWCIPGTIDKCRYIVSQCLQKSSTSSGNKTLETTADYVETTADDVHALMAQLNSDSDEEMDWNNDMADHDESDDEDFVDDVDSSICTLPTSNDVVIDTDLLPSTSV